MLNTGDGIHPPGNADAVGSCHKDTAHVSVDHPLQDRPAGERPAGRGAAGDARLPRDDSAVTLRPIRGGRRSLGHPVELGEADTEEVGELLAMLERNGCAFRAY